jgi:hypothetical protein
MEGKEICFIFLTNMCTNSCGQISERTWSWHSCIESGANGSSNIQEYRGKINFVDSNLELWFFFNISIETE